MKTRSGRGYRSSSNVEFTGLHMLYYAGLYGKLENMVGAQTLAIYNIDNYETDVEKFMRLNELEALISAMEMAD